MGNIQTQQKPPSKKRKTTPVKPWPPVPVSCEMKSQPKIIWDNSQVTIPRKVFGKLILEDDTFKRFLKKIQSEPGNAGSMVVTRDIYLHVLEHKMMVPVTDVVLTRLNNEAQTLDVGWCLPYGVLTGYWQWPNNLGSCSMQMPELEWGTHCDDISAARSACFGTTFSECVTRFMTHLAQFHNRQISLTMTDLSCVGARVLAGVNCLYDTLIPDKATLMEESTNNFVYCSEKPVYTTMVVRDGYIVHSNPEVLGQLILPLVLAQPQHGKTNLRQLVILDQLPQPEQLGTNYVIIHSSDTLMQPSLRKQLKANNICVYVLTGVIHILCQLCLKKCVARNIPGQIQHKFLRETLGYSTILSDLPWDRVITISETDVGLPLGHKIGFWWTLCTPNNVTTSNPPLSVINVKNVSKNTKQHLRHLLNRHRMIDLTNIAQ